MPGTEARPSEASPHSVSFSKLHPCAALTASQLRRDSRFPSEVSLEPCDCLELFNVMTSVFNAAEQSDSDDYALDSSKVGPLAIVDEEVPVTHTAQANSATPSLIADASDNDDAATERSEQRWRTAGKEAINKLAPDRLLSQQQQICRSAVRVWESQLKEVLVSWATQHGPVGFRAVQQVLEQLRAGSWSSGISSGGTANNPLEFYRMLRLLDQQGMLPMLTFSFDRTKCEHLAGEQLASTQVLLCECFKQDAVAVICASSAMIYAT